MHKLIGERFGKLLVIKDSGRRTSCREVILECRCECGNQSLVRGVNLTSGKTTSCGCLQAERVSAVNHIHGHTNVNGKPSATYRSWEMMKQRCTNPKATGYKNYGGRGIKLYGPWQKFKNFLRDMGIRPDGYSISRINHDGNYCPENCEWAPAHSH